MRWSGDRGVGVGAGEWWREPGRGREEGEGERGRRGGCKGKEGRWRMEEKGMEGAARERRGGERKGWYHPHPQGAVHIFNSSRSRNSSSASGFFRASRFSTSSLLITFCTASSTFFPLMV